MQSPPRDVDAICHSRLIAGLRMEQMEPGNGEAAENCVPVVSLLAGKHLRPRRTHHPDLTLSGAGALGSATLHSST